MATTPPAGQPWPGITFETLHWTPSATTGRLADLIAGDYDAAVPPDIAEAVVNMDSSVARLCQDAAVEIGRFDSELGTEIAPFAAILLRSESASSSQIENLTASAKAVLMAEAGDTSRVNATQIATNTVSMQDAVDLADDLDGDSILAMHRALLGDQHPDWAGQWRTQQVWIGGRAASPHQATFVPPHDTRIPHLIDDLIAFSHRPDIEPLTKALIAHAQFETIHPFIDGNGRTGRALMHSILRRDQLTRNVTVPVSAGLLTDTDRYFAALDAYRAGDINPILELGASAALAAIDNGRQLAAETTEAKAGWIDKLAGTRSDAAVWKIVDTLIEHPVTDANTVAERHNISTVAARGAINQLAELGIVKQADAGLRFRKWIAPDIATALDHFAQRTGRRNHP